MNVTSEWFQNMPTKRKNYHAGTLIFSEGDSADAVYVIESGTIRITRKMGTGRDISLALLGPKEFFGIISFMKDKPRTADAKAATDCVL